MSLRFTDGSNHVEAIGDLSEASVSRVVGRKALLKWVQEEVGVCYGTIRNKLQLPCFL